MPLDNICNWLSLNVNPDSETIILLLRRSFRFFNDKNFLNEKQLAMLTMIPMLFFPKLCKFKTIPKLL